MGKDLSSDKITQLADMVSLENAKKNPMMNPTLNGKSFIRDGKSGGWKKYFLNEQLLADFDGWIKENVAKYNIKEKVFEEYF